MAGIWQFSLIYIIPLIGSGISLMLAVFVWQKREVPGSRSLSYLLLAMSFWAFFEALEKSAVGIGPKVLFSQIQYLGIVSTPIFYLSFISHYTQQDSWMNRRNLASLWIIPVITLGMVATNELHYWHWSGFGLDQETGMLTYHYGPWFAVHIAYSYVCILASTIILLRGAYLIHRQQRRQIWMLLLAALIPWVANITYLLRLVSIPGLDLTPISFIATGILLTISISEFNLMNLPPIARSKLVDTMQDALIVVDAQGILVDLNPTSLRLVDLERKDAIGQPAWQALSRWPYLATRFEDPKASPTEPKLISDLSGRWYDSRISSLRNRQDQLTGFLIILRDVSDQRQAETELARLATVVDQASETVVITDLEGKIVYANPYFEQITGYTIQEAQGQNPRLLQSGEHSREFYTHLWDTISAGKIWKGTLINRRKDGSFYHEAATIFPIKAKSGKITNYAAVKRDITAQVEAEESLKYFSEQLENIHDVSMALSLTASFDEMCRLAVELGTTRLGFDRISFWFVDQRDPEFILGSFGIDEDGLLRDERDQKLPLSESPAYLRHLTSKDTLYYQEQTPLRNDQFEVIGSGDLVVVGMWDADKLIGYLCADNCLTQRTISEQQRSILVLFSQTVGNLAIRKKADDALHEFTALLAALHDVSMELSLAESFDEMCKQAVILGRQRLRFDRLGIWFVDPEDENYLVGSFGIDEEGHLRDERHRRLLIDADPIHRKILSGSPRLHVRENADLLNDQLEPVGKGEVACTGLWDGAEIIGYLSTDNLLSRKPITSHQLEILVLFAQTIGNIGTRILTSEKTQRRVRNQALLNDITSAAISQSDFHEMLQILADRMGELFNADGCFITLWDEDKAQAIPMTAYGDSRERYQETEIDPDETTITKSSLSAGEILVIEDVFNSPYLSKRLAQHFSASSVLALPLIANEIKLGAALISFDDHHQFSQAEIELGKRMSQQIALAVLKAKLLEDAKRQATEAETLRQASGAVAATLQREEAIERILEELNRVIPYDSASVQLLRGNELEIVGERGFEPHTTVGLRFTISKETPNAIVFERREPYILADAPQEFEAFRHPPHNHIRGWMGVPLRIHDRIIGMLALDSIQPGQFNNDDARLAQAFADQVAVALENTRLFEETQWLAIHDPLTGLFNRRHFMSLAWNEFQRTKRYYTPLSVIMLDIDHFKIVNDTHGHLVGDQVLQFVANYCKRSLRVNDVIGRYGGEEFVILLPETAANSNSANPSWEPAKVVAERLRHGIEEAKIETDRGKIRITISLGVSELGETCRNIENLIDCADQALLIAKQTGRNKVVIWQDEQT